MHEAKYYYRDDDGILHCELCPNACVIELGERGSCRVRKNKDGYLITENYGRILALHVDPLEKKPLYHFYPGQKILSAGSFGCNLNCGWCQNSSISQVGIENFRFIKPISPLSLSKKAIESHGIGLAYTYNEPSVWFEFMLDTAVLLRKAGIKNVVVSNGYIMPNPLNELLEVADAFNIDLKGFSSSFYSKYCGGSLKAVCKSLKAIVRKNIHLELTFLVIPGLNDSLDCFKEMLAWITGELGNTVPLHISRYYPSHNIHQPPTPVLLLNSLYEMASEHLHFVYLGNVVGFPERSSTRCPDCGKLLATRDSYTTRLFGVSASGNCEFCGRKIFVTD